MAGLHLHASRPVPADDPARRERLLRYIARPPVPDECLHLRADGKVLLDLARPWSDGTTQLVFDPLELIEKLAAQVGPPRANLVRYHGYLAPAAPWRAQLVPGRGQRCHTGSPAPSSEDHDPACHFGTDDPRRWGSGRWIGWARLLGRVLGFDVLHCERCGGRMKAIATLHRPPAVAAILDAPGLPSTAPEPSPAAHQLELFGA